MGKFSNTHVPIELATIKQQKENCKNKNKNKKVKKMI